MDREAAVAQLAEVRDGLMELIEGRWHDRWTHAAFERYAELADREEQILAQLACADQGADVR